MQNDYNDPDRNKPLERHGEHQGVVFSRPANLKISVSDNAFVKITAEAIEINGLNIQGNGGLAEYSDIVRATQCWAHDRFEEAIPSEYTFNGKSVNPSDPVENTPIVGAALGPHYDAQEQAKPSEGRMPITCDLEFLALWDAYENAASFEYDEAKARLFSCINDLAHPPASPAAPERSGESGGDEVISIRTRGAIFWQDVSAKDAELLRPNGVYEIRTLYTRPAASSSAAPSDAVCTTCGGQGGYERETSSTAWAWVPCAKCNTFAAPAPTVAAPSNEQKLKHVILAGAEDMARVHAALGFHYKDVVDADDMITEIKKLRALAAPTGASQSADALRSIRDLAAFVPGAGVFYNKAENALAAIECRDAIPNTVEHAVHQPEDGKGLSAAIMDIPYINGRAMQGRWDLDGDQFVNRAQIAALIATFAPKQTAAQGGVPTGWKLVPIDPTHEIISAMLASKAHDEEGSFDALLDLIGFSGENKTHTVLKAAYAAMLAAAPALAGDTTAKGA